MGLKLTWVNHASFIISDGDVTMISDPWLEGTAFNDGWKLLSPTVLQYDDFKNITHIWFSHEHPDHFAPLVIKKIPIDYRKNITVLYQCTIDNKVVEFCKKQGFKSIIQIYPKDKIKLSDNMIVSCQKVENDTDSWMLIETPWERILNLNDCHFHHKSKRVERLKKIVGEIDILLTQFSYAHWVGNHDQLELHREFAKDQLSEMNLQIKIIDPKFVIPFASYVWFCHEENYFMNASVNKIRDVYDVIPKWGSYTPLVFYPGDVWNMSEKWEGNEAAIKRYEQDFNRIISSPELIKAVSVTLGELQQASEEFRVRCMKDNNFKKLLSFRPFTFYLTDYSRSFRFSYLEGMQNENIKPENTDVSLSSQALLYCFKNDWGFATLRISGRYENPLYGDFYQMEIYQWVADLKNRGKKVPKKMARIWTRLKQSIINE
jgi:UDP-MurNAc hydroxylase